KNFEDDDSDATITDSETVFDDPSGAKLQSLPLFWENDALVSLISKEGETHLCCGDVVVDESLEEIHVEAVN
ncbi:hypothetical protein RYX36_011652, partial [Vicia faba]